MPLLGLLGVVLAAATLGLFVARGARTALLRSAWPTLLVAAMFVPARGIPLGGYLLGLTGEPSLTSLVLLAVAAIGLAGGTGLARDELEWISLSVTAGALLLYPSALGGTAFDTYGLGYSPRGLLLGLALLALAAGLAGRSVFLACLVLAIGAFRFGLGESQNLWDYLIDPWVALYAVSFVLRFTIFGPSSKSR